MPSTTIQPSSVIVIFRTSASVYTATRRRASCGRCSGLTGVAAGSPIF